jgi:hypothetical protein
VNAIPDRIVSKLAPERDADKEKIFTSAYGLLHEFTGKKDAYPGQTFSLHLGCRYKKGGSGDSILRDNPGMKKIKKLLPGMCAVFSKDGTIRKARRSDKKIGIFTGDGIIFSAPQKATRLRPLPYLT